MSRAEGCRTYGELIQASGLPETEAVKLLKALAQKGVFVAPSRARERAPEPEADRRPSRYEGFIFNPAELAQAPDLPLDLKKEILYLDAKLGEMHHYDLLGVRPRTPPEEIRRRYVELTRTFHPDRYYGKDLGVFKEKLARVFQAIHDAYQVLSDPKKKAEYDAKTPIPPTLEEIEEMERQERRKEAAERRKQLRREGLKRRNPVLQRAEKARQLVAEAEAAEAREDFRRAANLYQLAREFDPEAKGLDARIAEARRRAGARIAEELLHQAMSEETLGNLERAEALLREAVEAYPEGAEIRLRLARFLLARGPQDPAEVVALGKRATELERSKAEAWVVLGHAYLAQGDKKAAKRAYQRAVQLDETADEAKEGLKSLRWVLL